jgi:peptidoglycan/xylan/chitin deacetylase (PgdA/CDA1 family)
MRLSRLLRHPLVLVPVTVTLLTAGWVQYTQNDWGTSRANPGANLLAPAEAARPTATEGWRVGHSGAATVSLTAVSGRVDDHALQAEVSSYVSGDVTLTSPRVPVSPQQNYLFKAYAASGPAFTLLARYYYQDGSDRLVGLQDYPGRRRDWSTLSAAFNSGESITAVQYVFRLASTGMLEVDGAYIVAAEDVQVSPSPPSEPNLIPNPELAAGAENLPEQWSPYQSGWSQADFQYLNDASGNYLETRIADYQGGEAKWQYPPIAVQPDDYYRFTATYRSEQPVDVVAEFELTGGGRQFLNLSTEPPAGDWTAIAEHVQVPNGATSLMLTLVSHGNGITGVRDHSLVDVSKPGAGRWSRPLISITFDDGWQSAYDNAVPLLNDRGYKGTFYVNPATVETSRFLTASELRALHEAGHDVAVHGYEDVDLTGLSAERIEYQLAKGQGSLAEVGLPTNDLAAPLGRSDAQVEFYARKHFQSMRGMEAGINTRQNMDPYALKVFYVDSHTTPEELSRALADAADSHGWLILVYHQISAVQSDGSERATITRKAFERQLEMIGGSGIAVEPVSKAFAEVHSN